MKKIVLSLAGVLAATAFAPEAAAVPAFARQTGMACTACHAQHFPILNSFGRAYKASGYTMMGAQAKVEGNHLSIPDTLNASIVMKIRHQKNNSAGGLAGNQAVQTLGDGQWQFFDEFALLFGGRVADNVGFLLEGQMIANTAPFAAGFKMPFVFDVGGAKLSVTPFQTDALGASYGYELSSGGVQRANRWAEHRAETSAIQYNAPGATGAATGVTLAAQNDMGFIAVTKWAQAQMAVSGGVDMDSNYIRVAATPTVGNWAMVVGLGRMSGSSFNGTSPIDTDQTFFDFQAQGEVGGKELGVYAQHAKAPATANSNAYNTAGVIGNPDRKAWTIGADWSVIPHVLTIGAAYRNADTGAAATVNGDDAVTVTAVYDLYQNVAFHLNHSSYSGSSRNAVGAVKRLTTFMLEAAW
jgi:hypothetical protein